MIDRAAVAKIGNGDTMPVHLKRRSDVLEAERLDSKEWSKTKPIVGRYRSEQ
jgi:hypothetical protein